MRVTKVSQIVGLKNLIEREGGLSVLIKRTILNGISLIDKSVPDIMWFKLDSKVFGFKKD